MVALRIGTLLVPLALLACNTSSSSNDALTVEFSTLDFDDVLIGSSRTRDFTITNEDSTFLDITGVWLSEDTSPYFTITSGYANISLAPDASVTCVIRYSPGEETLDVGTLYVESSNQSTVTISLVGGGIPIPAPEIELSMDSLDFGEVLVGSSTTRAVTVQNIGSDNLDVRNISFNRVTSGDFNVKRFPEANLAPGASLSFDVIYTPGSENIDTGGILFDSDDLNEPRVELPLTGSGITAPAPELEVTPLVLDFGVVLLEESRSREIVIGNKGTAPLEVSDLTLGAGVSDEMILVAPAGKIDIAPGSQIVVEVVYAPEDETADSGTFRLLSNDTDEFLTVVSFAGSGALAPLPEIEVTPRSLVFGDVLVGDSRSLDVTVRNTGSAVLIVDGVSLGAGTSPALTVESTPGSFDLDPAESRKLTITYNAADELPESGTLRIRSNDADESLVVLSISGNGAPVRLPEIEVDRSSLAFGSVEVGSVGTRGLTITNTGAAPLTLDSIRLGAGTSSSYAITSRPASGSVLGVGQSRNVAVDYVPTSAGVDTGTIRIESDDQDESVLVVPLSGTGTDAPVDTSVTLAWDAPTTDSNGSPLQGLTGYRLHIGRDSRNYTRSVNVGNVTTHTLDSLTSGRNYIAVTAYNGFGESTHSVEIMVDVGSSALTRRRSPSS